jgi:zinc ribbon protein
MSYSRADKPLQRIMSGTNPASQATQQIEWGNPYWIIDRLSPSEYLTGATVGIVLLLCPSCGKVCEDRWNVCPNCGAQLRGTEGRRPADFSSRKLAVSIILSLVAAAGLMVVGAFMAFVADAPGIGGSSIANLFHEVGTLQFALGLLVTISMLFVSRSNPGFGLWSYIIIGLGLVSIFSLVLVAAAGTIGVLFFVIPGLLVLVAGRLIGRLRTTPSG